MSAEISLTEFIVQNETMQLFIRTVNEQSIRLNNKGQTRENNGIFSQLFNAIDFGRTRKLSALNRLYTFCQLTKTHDGKIITIKNAEIFLAQFAQNVQASGILTGESGTTLQPLLQQILQQLKLISVVAKLPSAERLFQRYLKKTATSVILTNSASSVLFFSQARIDCTSVKVPDQPKTVREVLDQFRIELHRAGISGGYNHDHDHALDSIVPAVTKLTDFLSEIPSRAQKQLWSLRCEPGTCDMNLKDLLDYLSKGYGCVDDAAKKLLSILNNENNTDILDFLIEDLMESVRASM